MSVGGIIVDIVPVRADKWWIDTIDKSDLMHGGRTCAVYCDPSGETIVVGDALWWQGGHCFWTPVIHPDGRSDVKLPKLGFSGVAHPHKPRCPICDCTLEFCAEHGVCEAQPEEGR